MEANFLATFRPIVGSKTVKVDVTEGATLQQLIKTLVTRFPPMGVELFDENGNLRGHVHVFVNGRDAPFLDDQMETVINPSDTISVFPAVGGG